MRFVAASALCLWVGATLLLSNRRWFSRRPLTDRLRPYVPGRAGEPATRRGIVSVDSFREVIGPLAAGVGGRLARLFGVEEDLSRRLRRVHSPLDATAFRVRQLGWAVAAFGAGAVAAVGLRVPPLFGILLSLGAPLLAFLVLEQQLARESARWQQRIFLELPVISEQLGMLLSSGYSLNAALARVAGRGHGACAADLRRVLDRVRQGLTESAALGEWAALAGVAELDRLVHVLALNRTPGDVGGLLAQEARLTRQEVQRRRLEQLEKRAQQVWIPVTVATLVPGVIFLVIPFTQAMRLFTGP